MNAQKNEAYKANSNSVVYNSLKIELENKKSLLEALSKRQSETDVSSRLKGLEALNVWIVDKADYPLKPGISRISGRTSSWASWSGWPGDRVGRRARIS